MDWQPIETAPKDGTEVLVWAHGLPLAARWHQGHWWEALNEEYDLRGEIAHWMPLPDAPTSSPAPQTTETS